MALLTIPPRTTGALSVLYFGFISYRSGLGKHLNEASMEAFSKVGTPLYMAPEILCAETIMCADKTSSGRYLGEKHVLVKGYDWKSEVWSLGCVLY